MSSPLPSLLPLFGMFGTTCRSERCSVCLAFSLASFPKSAGIFDTGCRSERCSACLRRWGLNSSPEGKDHGFTHCFTLTFDSEADRDAYLPHPAHQHFGATYVRGAVDDVFVLDHCEPHDSCRGLDCVAPS